VSAKRLLFLASGRGSCFRAVCDAWKRGDLPQAEIVGLLCNKPQAPVLAIARDRGVASKLVATAEFKVQGKLDRATYEEALAAEIRRFSPDFICLAGYMLLLGEKIVREWSGRILNIHPALLPSFKGLHAQKQALEYGAQWTGCTVHFVTEALDDGPIVAQGIVEIKPEDSEDSLSERLLPIEHQTYVRALQRLTRDRFQVVGNRILWLG
jgi:phosphoribosylglycinamide formyltransferase-1